MVDFDVLAVRGNEAETLHVELAGTVPNGVRADGATGDAVEVIGRVVADDAATAHDLACAEFL
jgi:hypothetical protein